MRWPLSWSMRFALALSAVFAIGALSAAGLSYLLMSREMTDRLSDEVRADAESLALLAATGSRANLTEQILAQVRATHDADSLFVFVDGATGQMIGSLPVTEPFEGERRLRAGRDIPEHDLTGDELEDTYLAFGIRTGIGWIIVAGDESWVTESGEILARTTGWSLAIAFSLSAGLALFVARRNERRIDAMEEVLEQVGAGRMDIRINDRGNDDLADLSGRVDQMLGRLEAGVDSIRQVSTDVAHDLRAPLSRLRMRLEPQALSPAVPAETRYEIGSALMDIDAISASFDAILRLARLQSGSVELRHDPVELNALVTSVTDALGPPAEEAGHRLHTALPQAPVIVAGDQDLLAQALTNLVVNAIEHCPPPARITVELTTTGGLPVLSVADTGPGIGAADRARVLERFVRLDASRSVPGTGLGLSLVAAVANLHQARLTLADNKPGLRVSLWFPAGVPRSASSAEPR